MYQHRHLHKSRKPSKHKPFKRIAEHKMIQHLSEQEGDLYAEFLEDGIVSQSVFVQNQQVARNFQNDLNSLSARKRQRGQDEGVRGILQ